MHVSGDDYKQPGDRIRAMKQESRDNLKQHLCAWLGDPKVLSSPPPFIMYHGVHLCAAVFRLQACIQTYGCALAQKSCKTTGKLAGYTRLFFAKHAMVTKRDKQGPK